MDALGLTKGDAPAAIRHLASAGFVLATVALILSFGRHGGPALVPEARRLMLPAGLALVPLGVWHVRHRSAYIELGSGLPHGFSAAFILSIALALLGGSLDYDDPDAPWLLLLIPGAGTMAFFARWLAFSDRGRAMERRWVACAGAIMFALAAAWFAASEVA